MNTDKALSILGLDPKATPADIKSAYRRLARANHPDKMGSAELFKLVQEAYETLQATVEARDKSKREVEYAELERRIAESNEAKHKAEERSDEALRLSRLLGPENVGELWRNAYEALLAAVEAEAILRVERVRLEAEHKEGRRKTEAECPELAQNVITAEWFSMRESTRNLITSQELYRLVIIAIRGKPNNDNDRHLLTSGEYVMSGDAIWDDLIEQRAELTDQDFRVGGFYIWGRFLIAEGCPRLAIRHFNSAQWLRPSLWQIYSTRGDAKMELGRNAVRKCLCQRISGTCCDNAREALRHYSVAMTDYVAGLRFTSHNRDATQELHLAIEVARSSIEAARKTANSHRAS